MQKTLSPYFISVCKRWQTLSQLSWYNVKELTVDKRCWGYSDPSTLGSPIKSDILLKIINRCSQYLTKIIFPYYDGSNMLSLVTEYCPNIQYIEITN